MGKKFNQNDIVGFYVDNSDVYEYGRVIEYKKKTNEYEVFRLDSYESTFLPESALEYMPPKEISMDDRKKLLRYECTYKEFSSDIVPEYNWEISDHIYEYTLEDMSEMLKNIINKNPDEEEFEKWLYLVFDLEYSFNLQCKGDPEYTDAGEYGFFNFDTPLNDAAMAESIFNCFCDLMYYVGDAREDTSTKNLIDFNFILSDIENYRNHRPVKVYMWSYNSKRDVCRQLDHNELGLLNEEQQNDVRQIISELIKEDDPDAIEALGYSYYGGNNIYPCDWIASRDCFLKLMEMDTVDDFKKCYFANTLGYIYYYGRCNNGVPEYDKAFRYYSIGAAGFIYESMYKLSDMYIQGYGTMKNKRAAVSLVDMVYGDTVNHIINEEYDCKFADAALRKGNLCRDGLCNEDAYYYYTLAEFAIRKRSKYNHYGDNNVLMGIQKELAKIREEQPLRKPGVISTYYLPDIIWGLFNEYSCEVTVKLVKGGVSIKVKRLPKPQREKIEKVFECLPEYGYCKLIDRKTFKAITDSCKITKETTFIADSISSIYDQETEQFTYVFTHHYEQMMSFTAERFTYKLSMEVKKNLEEYLFASVEFTPGGKTYDYICNIPDVKAGDKVIVSANGEEKAVKVRNLFKMQICDMPLDAGMYKEILRRV